LAPIGLRGLAAALGLSTYTVSRALSGHADVAEATRRRVREKAEEMGYTPHLGGRMLRSGRSDTVGFVLTRSGGGFLDPYFLPVLNGLETTLAAAGLDLLVTGAPAGKGELEVFRRLVDGRRADALVFSRVRPADERVAYLTRRAIPFTTLGRAGPSPAHPFVDVDHRRGGEAATGWLLDQGHRRVGLINTPGAVHASLQRRAGWEDAHRARELVPDAVLLAEGDYTAASGQAAMRGLLGGDGAPTAVICGNDEMAYGAMEALRAAGCAIGHDVSVIGCDDLPMAALTVPTLTTFRTSVRQFGEMLGQQVIDLLAGREPVSELLSPELVMRGSAGPPADAAAR